MRQTLSYMLPLQESPLIFTTTLQENPHPPPCPLAPILYRKESRFNEVKYFLKSMASKGQRWGCKGSLSEFKTQALFSA